MSLALFVAAGVDSEFRLAIFFTKNGVSVFQQDFGLGSGQE